MKGQGNGIYQTALEAHSLAVIANGVLLRLQQEFINLNQAMAHNMGFLTEQLLQLSSVVSFVHAIPQAHSQRAPQGAASSSAMEPAVTGHPLRV